MRVLATLSTLLVFAVRSAGGQVPTARFSPPPTQPSVVRPVLIGAAAAVVGSGGGFFLGAVLDDCRTGYVCERWNGVAVAVVAGTFGMALGVHLGNRRLGNLLADVVAVTGVGAGLVTAKVGNLAVIPLIQLAAAVAVERRLAANKLPGLILVPLADGRLGVGVSLSIGPTRVGIPAS